MSLSLRNWVDKGWMDDTHGQAVVEFALVVPILLFLLFAIFVVGYWMNVGQVVSFAARQGVRQGVLTNDNGQIQGAIATNLAPFDPGQTRTAVAITPTEVSDPGRSRGNPLTVEVIYTMPFSFEELPEVFRTVRGKAVARMECEPETGATTC